MLLQNHLHFDHRFLVFKHLKHHRRYLEGLAQALRVFNKKQKIPTYRLVDIGREKMLKMNVKSDQVCMYIPGNQSSFCFFISLVVVDVFAFCKHLRFSLMLYVLFYNSFIDLQDKLHQNICRYMLVSASIKLCLWMNSAIFSDLRLLALLPLARLCFSMWNIANHICLAEVFIFGTFR